MITVKKLYSLKTGTRLRKIVRILEDWERELLSGRMPDRFYQSELMNKMTLDPDLSENVKTLAQEAGNIWRKGNQDAPLSRRLLNSLRHALLSQLGISQADWDFIHPGDKMDRAARKCFEGVAVYLDEIRSPFNVGSIFRTAESLGVSEILLSPGTADPLHPRSVRTSMGCTDRLPWRRMNYNELSGYGGKYFALELGGTPVHQFQFPVSGVLILGSEEVGVSPECLHITDQSLGQISIPLVGWKGSLNVSVAYGIVMSLWARSLS